MNFKYSKSIILYFFVFLFAVCNNHISAQNIDYSKLSELDLEILSKAKKLEKLPYDQLSAKDLETIRLSKEIIRKNSKTDRQLLQEERDRHFDSRSRDDYLATNYNNYYKPYRSGIIRAKERLPDVYRFKNENYKEIASAIFFCDFHDSPEKKQRGIDIIYKKGNLGMWDRSSYTYLLVNKYAADVPQDKDSDFIKAYKEKKHGFKNNNPALYYLIEAQEYMFGTFGKRKSDEKARNNLAMSLAYSAKIDSNEELKAMGISTVNDYVNYLLSTDRTETEYTTLMKQSNFNFRKEISRYSLTGYVATTLGYITNNSKYEKEIISFWKKNFNDADKRGQGGYSLTEDKNENIYFNAEI